MEDTETAAPQTPPQEELPSPVAPVEPETPQPVVEEQAPPGEQVVADKTPPTWGQTPSEALEHEDFQPLLEERDKTNYDTAYTDIQSRLQPVVTRNRETLDQILESSKTVLTTLKRASEDGNLDQRTVEDLLTTHRPTFEALNGAHRAVGVRQALDGLAQAVGITLSPSVELAYNEWSAGKTPTSDFIQEFAADVKATTKSELRAVEEKAEDKGYQRGLKEGHAANVQQQRANQPPGGPNLAPGAGTGGRSDKELLLDPTTPIETIREIRTRQRLAG